MTSLWINKDESGTEYYYHPFLDVHSFYSPDRKTFPFIEDVVGESLPIPSKSQQENTCDFCLGKTFYTTPDKSVLILDQDSHYYINYPTTEEIITKDVFLRRQGNLFEIIPYSFWQHKYHLKTSQADKDRISKAFEDPTYKKSLEFLLSLKYNKKNAQPLNQKNKETKMSDCEAFFAGFHELITSGKHYQQNATHSNELFHSGRISWQQHRLIFDIIFQSMEDMLQKNSFIQYIAIFQNWLSKAGASFEHWHKQILATDFWGEPLLREQKLSQQYSDIYQRFVCYIANQEETFFAENDHAIAYIETGTKSGQIVVCSKSSTLNPLEQTQEEQQGMSDLLHAIYTTFPTSTPYNEGWIYTPFNQQQFKTPWRITINIRTTVNAGFENITQHLITSMSIKDYAQLMRDQLQLNTHLIEPSIRICPPSYRVSNFNYI